MYSKPEIIGAIKLAIEDHKAYAGRPSDWAFIDKLIEARKIVEASPEREPIVRFGSEGQPVYYQDEDDASEHFLRMAEGEC